MSTIQSTEVLCRACLKILPSANEAHHLTQNLSSHLDSSEEYRTVLDLFLKYTFLEFYQFTETANYLCAKCYGQLIDFHKFWKQCIASHSILLERYTTDSIKTEPLDVIDGDDELSRNCKFLKVITVDVLPNVSGLADQNDEDPIKDTKTKGSSDHSLTSDDSVCDKKDNVAASKVNSTKSKRGAFHCDICGKYFKIERRFDGHMRKHMGLKAFACQECGKGFNKIDNYKLHMNVRHPPSGQEPEKFICGVNDCGKVYYVKNSLQEHIIYKHLKVPRRTSNVMCDKCGRLCRSESHLNAHLIKHMRPNKVKCMVCSKMLGNEMTLKEHMKRHNGVRKHVCSICGVTKITKGELAVHFDSHLGDKRFSCHLCSKVFKAGRTLKAHIDLVHLGKRQFRCEYCDSSFGRPRTLREHVMTHTGERPHVCSVCGKGFIQRTTLRTHMKIHETTKRPKRE